MASPTLLCLGCQGKLRSSPVFNLSIKAEQANPGGAIYHVGEIEVAATQGCPLCHEIRHRWSNFGAKVQEAFEKEDTQIAVSFEPRGDPLLVAVWIHARIIGISPAPQFAIGYDVTTSEDDPAASKVHLRRPNPDVGSPRAFNLARSWLDECQQTHTGCAKRPTTLPLRLVRIAPSPGGDDLRLISPAERVPYVALSYCWGAARAHVTTRANLAQRVQRGFDSATLPATLRDAVEVARRLGAQHLWADSLCIVQDDAADKQSQIPAMGDYYGGSLVTVLAQTAASVDDGFLHTRPAAQLPPVALPNLPLWLEDSATTTARGSIDLSTNVDTPDPAPATMPLTARAWTLQERLLSARNLIYAPHQLRWECGAAFRLDGGVPARRAAHEQRQIPRLPRSAEEVERAQRDVLANPFWQPWSGIVADFTARALTFPDDRTVALAAVVALVERECTLRCAFGLWLDSGFFVWGLRWRRAYKRKGKQVAEAEVEVETAAPRRSGRAPSWSWMSVDFACSLMPMMTPGFYRWLATVEFPPSLLPQKVESESDLEQEGSKVTQKDFLQQHTVVCQVSDRLSYSSEVERVIAAEGVVIIAALLHFETNHWVTARPKDNHGPYDVNLTEDVLGSPSPFSKNCEVEGNIDEAGALAGLRREGLWLVPIMRSVGFGSRPELCNADGLIVLPCEKVKGAYRRVGFFSGSLRIKTLTEANEEKVRLF